MSGGTGRAGIDRSRELPIAFLERLAELERSYLEHVDDPIRASGVGGGATRWRSEREPILEAIESSGDLLDVGCANGYLLECLVAWGAERGLRLVPHGIDQGAGLIERARRRLPQHAARFGVADAWTFEPERRFRYVYSLYDCAPEGYREEYVRRLAARVVEPGGRLILGAYGSRSQGKRPHDVARLILAAGFEVKGRATGGDPPVAAFAWLDV